MLRWLRQNSEGCDSDHIKGPESVRAPGHIKNTQTALTPPPSVWPFVCIECRKYTSMFSVVNVLRGLLVLQMADVLIQALARSLFTVTLGEISRTSVIIICLVCQLLAILEVI